MAEKATHSRTNNVKKEKKSWQRKNSQEST
jgi:hypothetical protein